MGQDNIIESNESIKPMTIEEMEKYHGDNTPFQMRYDLSGNPKQIDILIRDDWQNAKRYLRKMSDSFHLRNVARDNLGTLIQELVLAYESKTSPRNFDVRLPNKNRPENINFWDAYQAMLKADFLYEGIFLSSSYYAKSLYKNKFMEIKLITIKDKVFNSSNIEQSILNKAFFIETYHRFLDYQDFVSEYHDICMEMISTFLGGRRHQPRFDYHNLLSTSTLLYRDIKSWPLIAQIILELPNKEFSYVFQNSNYAIRGQYILALMIHKSDDIFRSGTTSQKKIVSRTINDLVDIFIQYDLNLGLSDVDIDCLPEALSSVACKILTQKQQMAKVKKVFFSPPDKFKNHFERQNYENLSLEQNFLQFFAEHPNLASISFNKMADGQRNNLITQHSSSDEPLLYPLLTGDFSGEYIDQPFKARIKAKIIHWQEYSINFKGIDWNIEFTDSKISKPNNALIALRMLFDLEIYDRFNDIFLTLTDKNKELMFDKIADSIPTVVNSDVKLKRFNAAENNHFEKSKTNLRRSLLSLMAKLEPKKIIDLLSPHRHASITMSPYFTKDLTPDLIALFLRMNEYFTSNELVYTQWSEIYPAIKYMVGQYSLESKTQLMTQDNLEHMKNFYSAELTTFVNKIRTELTPNIASTEWFLLGLFDQKQIADLGGTPGLTLKLFTAISKTSSVRQREEQFHWVTPLAMVEAARFELFFQMSVQESNAAFSQIMKTFPSDMFTLLLNRSTPDSLARALINKLKDDATFLHHKSLDKIMLASLMNTIKANLIDLEIIQQLSGVLGIYPEWDKLLASVPPKLDQEIPETISTPRPESSNVQISAPPPEYHEPPAQILASCPLDEGHEEDSTLLSQEAIDAFNDFISGCLPSLQPIVTTPEMTPKSVETQTESSDETPGIQIETPVHTDRDEIQRLNEIIEIQREELEQLHRRLRQGQDHAESSRTPSTILNLQSEIIDLKDELAALRMKHEILKGKQPVRTDNTHEQAKTILVSYPLANAKTKDPKLEKLMKENEELKALLKQMTKASKKYLCKSK